MSPGTAEPLAEAATANAAPDDLRPGRPLHPVRRSWFRTSDHLRGGVVIDHCPARAAVAAARLAREIQILPVLCSWNSDLRRPPAPCSQGCCRASASRDSCHRCTAHPYSARSCPYCAADRDPCHSQRSRSWPDCCRAFASRGNLLPLHGVPVWRQILPVLCNW